MNNLEELTLKIQNLIESEKLAHPEDIKYLNSSHAKLIAQIINNYNLSKSQDSSPEAQMIFLGAPTGAGKDTLVRKIIIDNSKTDFVVLNMDMFRHYHKELSIVEESITDKDFALKTNQTSYELYYIIQELILQEFPGTNVIVTGTMRDLEWVKQIISRYKNDKKTRYATSLATLAVPILESSFSIFERYLNMVNTRGTSSVPLRYTGLDYHDDTVKKFANNVQYFERELALSPETSLFNSIKVYKRHKDITDLSEDTLVYDSKEPNGNGSATAHIYDIMNSPVKISDTRLSQLLDIIKKNSDYLKNQNLYKSILTDLKEISPQLNRSPEDISK